MSQVKRIVVATDFTPTADAATAFAIDLAKQMGASITLVHAYEIPVYGFPDAAFVVPPGIAAKMHDAATAGLAAAATRFGSSGVSIETAVQEGPPWDVLNEVAPRIGADLVVIGTHGRRGFAHALLGSVAERVVRTCKVPVLTVRTPDKRG
jgi:nucleotide-binding universal stress UspA family protein